MKWQSLPPLNALRAFAAASEHRNLSRAAAELNVTHSAVSQQIRVLERWLGTNLVSRDRRGITLTPQGEYLANDLQSAFFTIAQSVEEIGRAEAARPLLVSITPMFASAIMAPRLSDFVSQHPEIDLSLQSTIDPVDLSPGGVDMAIRYGTGDWPGLETELLLPGALTVVARPDLIGNRNLTHPIELLDYPILQEHASVEFDNWLLKVGVPVSAKRNVTRVPGNLLLDGIRRGDGIGATVPAFISDELKSGELITLFDDPIPGIGYYLTTLPGINRPPLRVFSNWLKASIQDLIEAG